MWVRVGGCDAKTGHGGSGPKTGLFFAILTIKTAYFVFLNVGKSGWERLGNRTTKLRDLNAKLIIF